jgi:hypothetical protein
MTKEESRIQKENRLNTAIGLREPDHVPFAPIINGFYLFGYRISPYDAMIDARNILPGLTGFIRDYDPDAVYLPGMYGIPALEALGTRFIHWPGPTCGIPPDLPFQHTDTSYLEDDEYGEYIQDPTHFTLTKLLPRKHKNLGGLSKLYFREAYDSCFFNDLSILADPEVHEALTVLLEAGKENKKRSDQMAVLTAAIDEQGYSSLSQGVFCIPFDAFADSIRGVVRTIEDTLEFPDELEQALASITNLNVDRIVKKYKAKGARRIFIPLHCGGDTFISPASYERFYWPSLKKSIMTVIENDMTPIVFCEGSYNTRLEILSDVPKGKVVYAFESIDIKRVKETVGKTACVMGSVPTSVLAFGTVEEVIRATREQLEVLAPGGGFIMNSSIIIDNAKHENMRAWRDTTLKYGQY